MFKGPYQLISSKHSASKFLPIICHIEKGNKTLHNEKSKLEAKFARRNVVNVNRKIVQLMRHQGKDVETILDWKPSQG